MKLLRRFFRRVAGLRGGVVGGWVGEPGLEGGDLGLELGRQVGGGVGAGVVGAPASGGAPQKSDGIVGEHWDFHAVFSRPVLLEEGHGVSDQGCPGRGGDGLWETGSQRTWPWALRGGWSGACSEPPAGREKLP